MVQKHLLNPISYGGKGKNAFTQLMKVPKYEYSNRLRGPSKLKMFLKVEKVQKGGGD